MKLSFNYKKILAAIGAFLFISPDLNIIESILTYCGIGNHDVVKYAAIAIFAIMDLLLVIAFFKAKPSRRMFIVLIIFNVIYILPQVLNRDATAIMQYCLFTVPTTVATIMLTGDEEIQKLFFKYLGILVKVALIAALLYIYLLYFGTNRKENGMLMIENMTYGDMAYLFVSGFIVSLLEVMEEKSKIGYFALVVFSLAVLFAGARSAILCIVGALILHWLMLFISRPEKKKYLKMLIVTALTAATLVGGMYILPEGSRLDLVNIDISTIEFNGPSEALIFENRYTHSRINGVAVLYVPTGKEMSIYDAFYKEVVKNDRTKKETEEILREDIKNRTGEYIIVLNEDDWEYGCYYSLPYYRTFLWKAAKAEYKKNPIFGNGPLYFKNKYCGYFPHNIFLEAMTDFGIVGTVLLALLALFCFIKGMAYLWKKKESTVLRMNVLLFSKMPRYLLYTTLYSTASLAMTVIYYLTLGWLAKDEKQDKETA